MEILEQAMLVLDLEIAALQGVRARLGATFQAAVAAVLECRGKVIVTGMGKSGAVGRKIAGTLSSTGTPALFLHPGEGVHGDLGVIGAPDLLLALSQSGETDELSAILPSVKRLGIPIVAICGNPQSTLGGNADCVLDSSVEREACPLGLAPTASTTAMMALGDALALCVMQARRFTRDDYAQFHPAGALGRRLILRASDAMRSGEHLALVPADMPLREALFAITRAGAGAACVVDADSRLAGLVTDGDVRRHLLKGDSGLSDPVEHVMSRHPVTIAADRLAAEAFALMEARQRETGARIGEIPVVDPHGRPVGILMLKDLVRAGIL